MFVLFSLLLKLILFTGNAMRFCIIFLFAGLFIFTQPLAAMEQKDVIPVEEAFKFSVKAVSNDHIELNWDIAAGFHIYKDRIKISSDTPEITIKQVIFPSGVIENDAAFGEVEVYKVSPLLIPVDLNNPKQLQKLLIIVKYQGCSDKGICYPPQKLVQELKLLLENTPAITPPTQALSGFQSLAADLFSKPLLPADQAFQFFAQIKDAHTLHLNWVIADGYYLYKDRIKLNLETAGHTKLDNFVFPKGELHHDPEFGDLEIYRNDLSIDINLLRQDANPESLSLIAKYQGCADRGVCYPPMQSRVNLDLPALESVALKQNPVQLENQTNEQDKIVASLKQGNFFITLVSFFGFGLLLAFTPCVFPMIPILSGIIVGQSENLTQRKAFLLSVSYVLASALMYTIFGVLAALFGSNLQAAFQNPIVISVFSALFVVLSLSMFGFYNLEVPQALQNKIIRSSDQHRDGSYLGAAVMGALSTLIVGPCVAAPLAAALIYIGQSGDLLLGGSALFVLSLGMSFPLLLVGASAGKLLPKAGAWLNSTKAVFGVIMLAMAMWMLARILPAYITMLLTAALFIIPAVFLHALDSLPSSASGWQRIGKGIGVILFIFGSLELLGVSAGNDNILQPLKGLAANVDNKQAQTKLHFQRVHNETELDAQLQQAKLQHKAVMLDFYADWCVSCKEMEAYTFTDAEVKQILANFVLLQADVTENNAEDNALLKRFNLVGPPGIIFFASDGMEKNASRVIGYQEAALFVKTLQGL